MVEYMVRQAIIQNRASATVETAFNYAVDRISQEHPGREPVEFETGNGALDLRPPGVPNDAQPPQYDNNPPPQQNDAPSTTEPPASDRDPSGGQHCTGKGLFRYCTNG
jgi:hypothetical protein